MKDLSDCLLYGFVDTAYLRGRKPAQIAQELCDGGVDLIQLRAKDAPLNEVHSLAEQVREVTARNNVGLVINDYPEVASEVGAEFCHLGQEDFFGRGYTHISQVSPGGNRFRVGLSTHAPEEALWAVQAGADYLGIGPVYQTGTKPAAKPVTLEYVRWAAKHLQVPWFAIGGINLSNLDEVLEAGARRICVVSAILDARKIAETCALFRQRLTRR